MLMKAVGSVILLLGKYGIHRRIETRLGDKEKRYRKY